MPHERPPGRVPRGIATVLEAGQEPGRSIMKKALIIAAIAALATTPAFAHAHLIKAAPAADSTVTAAPTALVMDFSEGVQIAFTGVAVTGPDKAAVTTGAPTVSSDGKELTVPLTAPLAAGTYAVAWHALAADGHKSTGTYTFTVK
jgi:methionine-rich copper-binding protein CopC